MPTTTFPIKSDQSVPHRSSEEKKVGLWDAVNFYAALTSCGISAL